MFKVTNGNDTDFTAGYDGVQYLFPAGKTVSCPDEAIAHIFGFGLKDKTPILARHGWATVTESVAKGLAVLARFSFESFELKLDAPPARISHGPAPVLQGSDEEGVVPDSSESRGPSGVRMRKPVERFQAA